MKPTNEVVLNSCLYEFLFCSHPVACMKIAWVGTALRHPIFFVFLKGYCLPHFFLPYYWKPSFKTSSAHYGSSGSGFLLMLICISLDSAEQASIPLVYDLPPV